MCGGQQAKKRKKKMEKYSSTAENWWERQRSAEWREQKFNNHENNIIEKDFEWT